MAASSAHDAARGPRRRGILRQMESLWLILSLSWPRPPSSNVGRAESVLAPRLMQRTQECDPGPKMAH